MLLTGYCHQLPKQFLQTQYLVTFEASQVGEGVVEAWKAPELMPWRLSHLTMQTDFPPFHFHSCQVEVAAPTVGGVGKEEAEVDLQLDLWVGDQEVVVVKVVEAMTYPSLHQQTLGALAGEVEVVKAKMQG